MALKKNPRFDLKLHYRRTFEVGIVCSLCLLLLAFKYFPEYEVEKIEKYYWDPDITIEDVQRTQQEEFKPPEPPRPIIPIPVPDDPGDEPPFYEPPEPDPNRIIPPPPPSNPNDKDLGNVIFVAVEEMPSIIGGLKSLYDNIYYPEMARKVGIQGKVFIEAIVDKFGDVISVALKKGIGAGCDEVALDAVKKLKFNPGKQRGKPVNVRINIPIIFRLEN